MFCHLERCARRSWCLGLLAALLPVALAARAEQPASADALWQKLKPFAQAPEEFAGKLGPYRSPLKFADGSVARSAKDWARRRGEILQTWHKRLGAWPPLVERPTVKKLDKVERDGYTEYRVQVQIAPDGKWVEGYLLVPNGPGPFPAVVVPFYEPLTSIGRGVKGRGVGTHDYGLQLVKRGFVTLSIGTPGALDKLGGDTRDALIKAGEELRRQPLTLLAYVAANCLTALAQMPEVDASRIGIIGLSYGGKWSMFASCLDERFACAVWSDPGIVFNEKDSNVNYWEPWYLGYDPKVKRKPGVPSDKNPRTGLYKELVDAGEDLVDLHALMAPRPVLVGGGVQDPLKNWQALNHLVAVNAVLGYKDRAFLTARKTHIPTAEALEQELAFLEYFLKYAPAKKSGKPDPRGLWNKRAPVGDGTFEEAEAWITVYHPQKLNGTAIVICPGGGYGTLVIGPEGHGIAAWLTRHGITGIVLEYRLPKGRPLVPLLDAQRAIRVVRANAGLRGLDPARIGIMGFSAGGHLASTAGTHFDAGQADAADPVERVSCRPDFMILVYPVITMGDNGHAGSRTNLLGKKPDAKLVELFSNEKQVTAKTPPTFLAHAKDDKPVPPDHSRMFYEALRASKVPAEYLELPSGGHGLNGYKGPMWDAWQERSLKWLAEMKVMPAAHKD